MKLVRELQRMLIHSYYAKLLAVKKVTTNKGKKTPGIDNIKWETDESKFEGIESLNSNNSYTPKPLRRVHIKKANGKLRPLGIPTMKDRAMQTLHVKALDPVIETTADRNSYGFRKGRSCADAREQIFIILSRRNCAQWILEGDIKGCFDNISHQWLLDNIPMDKQILEKFLKSGYVLNKKLFPTKAGTPQGGAISACLSNAVLDGLEKHIQSTFGIRYCPEAKCRKSRKVNFIRYADDFIVTADNKETIEKIKDMVKKYLIERGLELSDEKTLITNIQEGFDFLGWNIKKYKHKLIIKPSNKSVQRIVRRLSDVIKENKASSQDSLILKLNQIITGWSNYHQISVSKRVFQKIDSLIFQMLWKWATRRHPNKGKKWIKERYWKIENNRKWVFKDTAKLKLMSDKKIIRHIPLKTSQNPYIDVEYFAKRKFTLGARKLSGTLKQVWKNQKGKCGICGTMMDIAEERDIIKKPGTENIEWKPSNIIMTHKWCNSYTPIEK